MGSASSPSSLSGSGLQVLSPARPGAHSCPLLPERQKTPPRCWGLGDRSVCKPRSSPGPPHRSPTSFQREGRDYSGRWSWLGLDAISATEQGSLAGSNFLIRTPGCLHVGSQPSLPSCETTPHRPPHRPLTRTGNPYVRESGGRQWGQLGGCRREVLAQSPCRDGQWRDQGSSPSSWPPAAACLGLPSTDVQTATSPSLLASESRDPSPQDREPEGWLHTTLLTAQPPHQPIPFLLSWVGGEQMGSGEADPLPKPQGCSE